MTATQALSTVEPGFLAGVGSAANAFVLAHPLSLSLAPGALLGKRRRRAKLQPVIASPHRRSADQGGVYKRLP
ncbi:hypothetical protein [uncultured Thiohalocapsa sp.]|uniref:hypothetical protein n=1 Tax=uncultured Thiohalocapsa sp. TaxID=768990 RepID=UPI0025DCED2E|nr:hypothetical protein [uncultured Thiohalocapsa sp.]